MPKARQGAPPEGTRLMAYHYDPSRKALLTPALDTTFFRAGRPRSEAALSAEFARLAYAPFERDAQARGTVFTTLERTGFPDVTFFSSASTQALLARDPAAGLAVLSFRGTEVDARDWATDLDTGMIPWPEGGRVHRGFAAALELIWPEVATALATVAGRLLYTGHSLGAALATLASTRRRPAALYTFGSPRVGDLAFGATLAGLEHRRFVHCCDIVTRVPPEVLDFRHVGALVYVDREGRPLPLAPSDTMASDQALARRDYAWRWAWRPGTMWTRDAADHAPINYVGPLMENA